ncbi:unnamed protein product [Oppiella nova]|uniref:Enoyl reductase (ER) domain-containing protein n=1 Tax=Oppiella nova TaxID=334625 RepID=A0A7R9M068_9ACAR|nr:unnamed protein product [Oppiella nova]CAG2167999.1 unnamed protein product [Oppiella nova]
MICTKCDTIGTVAFLFRNVSQQTSNNPDMDDMINISESGGQAFKYIFNYNDDKNNNNKSKIDFNSKPYSDILANNLVANVIKDGKLGTYRHIKLSADYDKCLSSDYYLNSGQSRDLSGIQWYDARQIPALKEQYDLYNKKLTKTRVEIYCSGLSFHDVMLVTGRIPSGPEQLFNDCILGCEYVGRRADTGERVMGIELGRCYATSINAGTHSMTTVPEHWSMLEASTILSTYSTLYYALIKRAHLKQGESILIHSAAGGVGQSAINMCRHYGCDIYATVGTKEKKEFLMTEYNIPENHIYSSRDILFKNQIMEATKGRGVDIVLNSLAGEKLDLSYECVANSGRFVEIGRYDMFQNRKIGMFDFLRNIQFIGIVIDIVLMEDKGFFSDFFEWLHNNCTNGCVKPINYTIFGAKEADKAFRYMTTGKHIGKVVIKMRDEESTRGPLRHIIPALPLRANVKTFFNPNKVYIITGGLGGFGLELIPWMQYFGARKFVVTSRFQELFGEIKYFTTDWVVSTANCLTPEGSQQLVNEAKGLAPIGGVKSITVGMLKDYQNGNVVTIKKHLDDIKLARKGLLKQKFIIPTDAYVRLNGVTTGRPVYFMPTLGLSFSMFEELAKKLDRPAIGLNWTRELSQLTTLKGVNKYYITLLNELEPNGKYDVVGYFDTALICAKLLAKRMAHKAVIIDIVNDMRFTDEELTEDFMLEFMVTLMSADIPDTFKEKMNREMKKEPDLKAKVKHMVNEIVDFAGTGLVATDMEEIFHIMLGRIRMLSEYRLNKKRKFAAKLKLRIAEKWAKISGKLVFIKPFKFDDVDDIEMFVDRARELYFLPGSHDGYDNIHVESVDTIGAVNNMTMEITEKVEAALK